MKLLPLLSWIVTLSLLSGSVACSRRNKKDGEVAVEVIELSDLSVGEDLTLQAGSTHRLSATLVRGDKRVALSALSDLDLQMQWTGSDGLTLATTEGAAVEVRADVAGQYTLSLTVEGAGLVEPLVSSLTLTVVKIVVDAGGDQSVFVGQEAQLQGEVVTSAADYTLTWSGSGLTFGEPHALSTTVAAQAPGTYRARLTVEVAGISVTDDLYVIATALSGPPAVHAGQDLQGVVGTPLQLSPAITTDGAIAFVQWSGSGLAFADAGQLMTTASASAPGNYKATLRVTLADGQSGSDTVQLTYVAAEDTGSEPGDVQAPLTAQIVGALSARLPAVLTLDSVLTGASDDASIEWSGAGLSFSAEHGATTEVEASEPGDYEVQLAVVDGDRMASATAILHFFALPSGLAVDAGPDLRVEVAAYLPLLPIVEAVDVLVGAQVRWGKLAGPGEAAFDDETVAMTRVRFDTVGTYRLSLRVTLGDEEAEDELIVEVVEPLDGSLDLALLTLNSNPDDALVQFLRSRGHTVTLYDPDTLAAEVELAGHDAALISSTMDSTLLDAAWAAGWTATSLPLLVWEYYALDSLGMTAEILENSAHDWDGGPYIDIEPAAEGHPALAGLSGRVKISTGESVLAAAPLGEAIILARLVGSAPAVGDVVAFAYESGAQLANSLAPARRVGLPLGLGLGAALTADGKDLVEAALAWVTDTRFERRTRVLPLGDEATRGLGSSGGYRAPLLGLLSDAGCRCDFVGTRSGGLAAPSPSSVLDWDHEGSEGNTTALALSALGYVLEGNLPDVVLLQLGAHDLLSGSSATELRLGLQLLIEQLRAVQPRVTIALSQLPPARDALADEVPEANIEIAALAAALQQSRSLVVPVDLFSGYDAVAMNDDTLLPNEMGAEHIAARLYPALQPLLICDQ